MQIDFKNNSISWMTYSGIQGLEMLALDWFCLLGIPGSDWDDQEALKLHVTRNLIQHFFLFFSSLVLVDAPLSSFLLGLYTFFMY